MTVLLTNEGRAMRWILLLFPLLKLACITPSAGELTATAPCLHHVNGVLYCNDAPFTGSLIAYHTDGSVKQNTPYINGRRHGTDRAWYVDGTPMEERPYAAGKKEGLHRGWWPDGTLKFVYHFEHGLQEGVAREWFADGTPFRVFHFENGKEQGSQKMWYEDGTLRANYVVIDGRRYGLIGSKPCSSPNS